MSSLEIRAELLRRDISQAQIADIAGRSRQLVHAVIARRQRGVRVRKLIATLIDKPYSTVWGEPESPESPSPSATTIDLSTRASAAGAEAVA